MGPLSVVLIYYWSAVTDALTYKQYFEVELILTALYTFVSLLVMHHIS